MTRRALLLWQTFRQEKNFSENCLEASSLRSRILLAYSIRSQSPRPKAQQSKKLPGDICVPLKEQSGIAA